MSGMCCLNEPSPDLVYVEYLLVVWARWVSTDRRDLGYPREAAFAHDMPRDFENFRITDGGDELVTLDGAIAKLDRRLRRVVMSYYLFRGTTETKAWDLRISPRTFYYWLKEAKHRIAAELTTTARF